MTGSVYIHIPFCVKKCSYCDFNSFPDPSMSLAEYTGLLCTEIEQQALIFPRLSAATLYFGGGTPSLLSPAQVATIIDKVRASFRLAESAEVTLEVNPGTVTSDKLQGYRLAGINRLSIGIQSLRNRELELLGRIHSVKEAENAVELAQRAGFVNISIDLMHSLPGQTPADWERTLHAALALDPMHISAYGLSIEANTPLAESIDQGVLSLPDEELAAAMFEITAEILVKVGFEHYEISSFARTGYRSRHNQVYWRRGNYLGFGAGAHSFVREPGFGMRWDNPGSLSGYGSAVHGLTSGSNREIVSCAEAMAEFFFLGLRQLEGVDLQLFLTEFGVDAAVKFPGLIEQLVTRGLLLRSGNVIRLSRRGVLLANRVFGEFI